MDDGFGNITWWGYSPALDLQETDVNVALKNLSVGDSAKAKECMNILLVGAGDCRHVLKTIARAYRHKPMKFNFYIIESSMELYCRHMLFLSLILEKPHRMGLQEKTELFLELFGNTLVREHAIEYVERMSTDFIKMVTDSDFLEKKLPLLDLSMLKFKERDFMEGILKFWRHKDRKDFDILLCWDLRLRRHLGARYDSRKNLFDWDYSMKLTEKGAEIIHYRNYQLWREKGVAYEIREGNYDVPNRTLASTMVFKAEGDRHPRRGYWGDIVVSPYIQFGIECEEKRFFKKSNKQLTSTSQDVAEYNMLSLLHELTHHTKYVEPEDKPKEEPPKAATLTEITEEDEEEAEEEKKEEEAANQEPPANPLDLEYESLPLPNVKIHFLPLGSAAEIHKKSKYNKLFDLVYLGNSLVHHINATLSTTFADKCSVVLETAKFMIDLKEGVNKEFNQKINNMAEAIPGCRAEDPVGINDAFAKFVFNRPNSS